MTCPPSSWPIGIRLRAVTKSPNQAARPSWPDDEGPVVGDRAVDEARHPLEERAAPRRRARRRRERRLHGGLADAEPEHGQADEEAGERPRDADVEEGPAVGDAARGCG